MNTKVLERICNANPEYTDVICQTVGQHGQENDLIDHEIRLGYVWRRDTYVTNQRCDISKIEAAESGNAGDYIDPGTDCTVDGKTTAERYQGAIAVSGQDMYGFPTMDIEPLRAVIGETVAAF